VTSSRKKKRPDVFGLRYIGYVSKILAVSPIVFEIWWSLLLLFEPIFGHKLANFGQVGPTIGENDQCPYRYHVPKFG